MTLSFIKSSEKKHIIEELQNNFGITDLPYLLIEAGKEKIRGFSGHLSKDEIVSLSKITNVEVIGLYILRKENSLRLSLDATHLLSNQINKSIIEITKEQYEQWIRGNDLDFKIQSGIYIIKYENYFIGCGKSNGQCIFNFVPKDRRLRRAIDKTN